MTPPFQGADHVVALRLALVQLEDQLARIDAWGRRIAEILVSGGRLLAAGNGGSAALAEHLTAELVGRYRRERDPLSAIALHSDGSSLSAITNDYGIEEGFARQVRAHGRRGDVLVALSTSGRSPNVLAAARAATERGLLVLGLTGSIPNPLAALCDDGLWVDAPITATVQEVHQVAVHLLCEAVEESVLGSPARALWRVEARAAG